MARLGTEAGSASSEISFPPNCGRIKDLDGGDSGVDLDDTVGTGCGDTLNYDDVSIHAKPLGRRPVEWIHRRVGHGNSQPESGVIM